MRLKAYATGGYGIKGLSQSGGTLSLPLMLPANPTQPMEAVTKEYVDNKAMVIDTDNIVSGVFPASRYPSFTGSELTSSGNGVFTLTNTGVAGGVYTKVTVDAKGRITGGGSLSLSDIPNLSFSSITTDKPTTLAGYGISDGVSLNGNVTMTGSLNITSTPTLNAHVVNKAYVDNAVSNISSAAYNLGDIVVKATSDTPTGFLKCNGGIVSKSLYPELYSIIGDNYSGYNKYYSGKPWIHQTGFRKNLYLGYINNIAGYAYQSPNYPPLFKTFGLGSYPSDFIFIYKQYLYCLFNPTMANYGTGYNAIYRINLDEYFANDINNITSWELIDVIGLPTGDNTSAVGKYPIIYNNRLYIWIYNIGLYKLDITEEGYFTNPVKVLDTVLNGYNINVTFMGLWKNRLVIYGYDTNKLAAFSIDEITGNLDTGNIKLWLQNYGLQSFLFYNDHAIIIANSQIIVYYMPGDFGIVTSNTKTIPFDSGYAARSFITSDEMIGVLYTTAGNYTNPYIRYYTITPGASVPSVDSTYITTATVSSILLFLYKNYSYNLNNNPDIFIDSAEVPYDVYSSVYQETDSNYFTLPNLIKTDNLNIYSYIKY